MPLVGPACSKCGAIRQDSQLGLEPTPEEYVANMVGVFRAVKRVLRDDGTVWLNLGSSYSSVDGYPLRPVDAAWLAGLIDGEGCIQIHRQKREGVVDQFQIDLSIGMMTAEAVQRAHELTGLGSCHQQNRGVWDWSVRGQQTATLLRAIYPYLVTKRRQAAYAVMLAEDVTERRWHRVRPATEEGIEYRESIKAAISALNQRQEPTLEMREPTPLPLGIKAKDDLLMPARLALALQQDGWFVRCEIVWSKANPMPESVTDRPTKSHEMIYLLSKSARYWYDAEAVREEWADERQGSPGGKRPAERNRGGRTDGYTTPPLTWTAPAARQWCARYWGSDGTLCQTHNGRFASPSENKCDNSGNPGRNLRSVWSIATQPYPGAHFATFPEKLVEPCIKAGCPELGTVLDPFAGSGTTGRVAQRLSRRAVLIDLNGEYLVQAMERNRELPLGLEAS